MVTNQSKSSQFLYDCFYFIDFRYFLSFASYLWWIQRFFKTAQDGIAIAKGVPLSSSLSYQDLPKTRLIKVIVEIATLALILFGFIVGLSKIVNSMISRDMERFMEFFESVHQKAEPILPNELYFSEFKKWRNLLMIWHWPLKNKKNRYSSSTQVWKRGWNKTQALQLKNSALEEEQKFSQGLLRIA